MATGWPILSWKKTTKPVWMVWCASTSWQVIIYDKFLYKIHNNNNNYAGQPVLAKHSQLRTGGFVGERFYAPCPCWWQLAHSHTEHARVLLTVLRKLSPHQRKIRKVGTDSLFHYHNIYKDIAQQSCAMVRRWLFFCIIFASRISSEPRAAHFRPAF